MKSFFNIIATVYNTEKYLQEFIDSIVGQTFDDWKLILINDGSTDGSLKVCLNNKEIYGEKIKVINSNNKGSLHARRLGVKEIDCEYVLFLDSDDRLRRDALEKIRKATERSHPDIVFFNYEKEDCKDYFQLPIKPDELFYGEGLSCIKSIILGKTRRYNQLWTKAFNSKIIDYTNIDFYERYVDQKKGTDLLQLLPLIDAAKTGVYIDEKLYFYRTNNCGISYTYNEKQFTYVKTLGLYRLWYGKRWNVRKGNICHINLMEVYEVIKTLACSQDKLKSQKIEEIKRISNSYYYRYIKRYNVTDNKKIWIISFLITYKIYVGIVVGMMIYDAISNIKEKYIK